MSFTFMCLLGETGHYANLICAPSLKLSAAYLLSWNKIRVRSSAKCFWSKFVSNMLNREYIILERKIDPLDCYMNLKNPPLIFRYIPSVRHLFHHSLEVDFTIKRIFSRKYFPLRCPSFNLNCGPPALAIRFVDHKLEGCHLPSRRNLKRDRPWTKINQGKKRPWMLPFIGKGHENKGKWTPPWKRWISKVFLK